VESLGSLEHLVESLGNLEQSLGNLEQSLGQSLLQSLEHNLVHLLP
jgi:hypothetical protein